VTVLFLFQVSGFKFQVCSENGTAIPFDRKKYFENSQGHLETKSEHTASQEIKRQTEPSSRQCAMILKSHCKRNSPVLGSRP
jgi:hypothetical protein